MKSNTIPLLTLINEDPLPHRVWCDLNKEITPPRLAWAHNWIFHYIGLTTSWRICLSVVVANVNLKVKRSLFFWQRKVFSSLWYPVYGSMELMVSWLTVDLIKWSSELFTKFQCFCNLRQLLSSDIKQKHIKNNLLWLLMENLRGSVICAVALLHFKYQSKDLFICWERKARFITPILWLVLSPHLKLNEQWPPDSWWRSLGPVLCREVRYSSLPCNVRVL